MRLHQRLRRDQGRHTDDWLITYADTITLLLCLFVIILSIKTAEQTASHPTAVPGMAARAREAPIGGIPMGGAPMGGVAMGGMAMGGVAMGDKPMGAPVAGGAPTSEARIDPAPVVGAPLFVVPILAASFTAPVRHAPETEDEAAAQPPVFPAAGVDPDETPADPIDNAGPPRSTMTPREAAPAAPPPPGTPRDIGEDLAVRAPPPEVAPGPPPADAADADNVSLPAIVNRLNARGTAIVEQRGDRITTLQISSAAFYGSGQATIGDAGKAILRDIAVTLKSPAFAAYHISIEGHTDDMPISTPQFQSNWELSTARAAAVVRFFLEQGIAPGKLSAAGYADTFPIAPNRTADGAVIPENQARNRRVVIKLEKLDAAGR